MSEPVVTRLIVLSCIPTASAMSFRTIGLRYCVPFSRKSFCLLTISEPTLIIVSFRFSMAFVSHFASDIFS